MLERQRVQRHVRLAVVAVASVAALYFLLGFSPERWTDHNGLKAEVPRWRLSMALAYTALGFLVTTLAIGPLHVLRRHSRPANHMLRRDVAIWAGVLALSHVAVGLFIHVEGWQFWTNFIYAWPGPGRWFPVQRSLFGLANWVGLAQATLIGFLLLISNNVALRRLGVRWWKTLQRSSYVVFALVVVHTLSYQSVERRLLVMRMVVWLVLGMAVALQAAGAWAVWRRRARSTPEPVAKTTTDNTEAETPIQAVGAMRGSE